MQLWLTQLDVEQGILLVRILLDDLQRDLFSGKEKEEKEKKIKRKGKKENTVRLIRVGGSGRVSYHIRRVSKESWKAKLG